MSKRPTYGDAIGWLIANERLDWTESSKGIVPDTVVCLSDLFAVPTEQIQRDIRATLLSAEVEPRKPKRK